MGTEIPLVEASPGNEAPTYAFIALVSRLMKLPPPLIKYGN